MGSTPTPSAEFCGILVKWLRNIKENQIPTVLFVASQFIKGRLKFKEIKGECFVAWLAMVFHVERKSRA
ncbi:hypothetical protein CO054_00160 [Candidatus Shapirobacteria bacterium CG_4_9_14_0_2_um_filter_39_11]|uniref:Uncharacterized protein n=1 Tax=Candidatus Shapirobacteria bacterium CG_4_9_14_0_2_um_filter_39_11 TaxID=1974478 RepID=A0A2M8ETK1_9BACT|nr:MAG: hypothetical protein CO054_00160 [Candidatus Shapirobacteria bacterium CG_4_9_14_0_2_um_filter_39_11]